MTPERWQRLEAIFFRLLELPAEGRSAYLDAACSGDESMRAEAEAVLSIHLRDARAADLDRLVTAPAAPRGGARLEGTHAGVYRLLELVGEGGMGQVYRAERDDRQYSKEVAVKLLRPGLAPEMAGRFATERQILARLVHPHIATLLDGGITEEGQPYLVMDHVRGLPITEFAGQRSLALEDRLCLLVTVCNAVQFAHANLIVHRDLKPSNLLVTESGRVMLLDFGIAKLLAPEGVLESTLHTVDARLLTPDYAAPEQLLGQPITTATDVYALGVLTYELLTGQRPFPGMSLLELQRAICQDTPRRPGAVVRGIPDDLDSIVLRALHKDPARRYASAGQLGEDLQRFLDRKPVIARADTLAYRTRKFVARNRLAVAAGATVLFTLTGAIAFTLSQLRQRVRALDAAQEAREKAARVADFVIGVFDANDPSRSRGDVITAREVLDQAAARIGFELAEQPALRADMEVAIARAYGALGLFEAARPLLEQALQRRRESTPDDPAVAEVLGQLASNRAAQGRLDEAVALVGEAREIWRAAPGVPREVAAALIVGASAETYRGQHAAARAQLSEALEVLDTAEDPAIRARALRQLGLIDLLEGNHEGALTTFEEALALAESTVGADHPFLYEFLEDRALALESLDRGEEAIDVHRRVLESRERVFGPEHVNVSYSLHNLGRTLGAGGHWEEALPLLERGLEIREARLGPEHSRVADVLVTLAIATFHYGDVDAAADRFQRAVDICVVETEGTQEGLLLALEGLAIVRTVQGRDDEALEALELAVERGYRNARKLEQPPFEKLASEPRFQRLRERVQERAAPEG